MVLGTMARKETSKMVVKKINNVVVKKINNFDVYHPKIEFILDHINKNRYFTFSKISVEWWQMFCHSLINLNISDINDNNIHTISDEMINIWNTKQKATRHDWEAKAKILEDVIKFITNKCPKNFIIGITDRTPGKKYTIKPVYPDQKRGRQKIIMQTIKKVIPKENILLDAMCWKYWAIKGDFKRIIDIANKRDFHVILVGPSTLNNFGNVCKIKNYSYMQIHDTKAALYVEDYKKRIIDLDSYIKKRKIYLLQGGSSTMWLCVKLHNKLKNSFIFDVGKGLNLYINTL